MPQPQLTNSPARLSSDSGKIAVIIPAYNVQNHIQSVLLTIPSFVEWIIVVDDASTDQTYQKIMDITDPRVRAHVHAKNQGVGGAMITGYELAIKEGADILVKMDGDGQMDVAQLPALVKPLLEQRAHFSKGNRFSDYRALEAMPPVRRFGNAWLSFLTKFASGYWNIFDVTNGYTAILASTFKKIDTRHIGRDYFFETSMLIELNITGAKILDVEMPARYGDEVSHLNIGKVLAKFPIRLVKGLLRRFYQRHMIRDFGALSLCALIGLPLFAFGVLYALYLWTNPPLPGQPTPSGTVMLAALPIILGFQLLLAALILDMVLTPAQAPHDSP